MFDGKFCPKCRKKLKRNGKNLSCLCGYHYSEEADNMEKRFFKISYHEKYFN